MQQIPDKVVIHYPHQVTTLRDVRTFEFTQETEVIDTTRDERAVAREFMPGPASVMFAGIADTIQEDTPWKTGQLRVMLHWDRVGDQAQDTHQLRSLDLSRVIDMRELRRMIEDQVQIALHSTDWTVELKVEVNLKGGPWKQLPFGYGHVREQVL